MPTQPLGGAGPYTWDLPALDPGDKWRLDLEAAEKGKYREYVPFDSLLVKNYDVDNRIRLEINGEADLDVDPSGKDTYEQTPIRLITVTNQGGTTISAGDVTVTVKLEPYGANEKAREEKAEPPIRGVIQKFTGL